MLMGLRSGLNEGSVVGSRRSSSVEALLVEGSVVVTRSRSHIACAHQQCACSGLKHMSFWLVGLARHMLDKFSGTERRYLWLMLYTACSFPVRVAFGPS